MTINTWISSQSSQTVYGRAVALKITISFNVLQLSPPTVGLATSACAGPWRRAVERTVTAPDWRWSSSGRQPGADPPLVRPPSPWSSPRGPSPPDSSLSSPSRPVPAGRPVCSLLAPPYSFVVRTVFQWETPPPIVGSSPRLWFILPQFLLRWKQMLCLG